MPTVCGTNIQDIISGLCLGKPQCNVPADARYKNSSLRLPGDSIATMYLRMLFQHILSYTVAIESPISWHVCAAREVDKMKNEQ
jgi:hypothetical protein